MFIAVLFYNCMTNIVSVILTVSIEKSIEVVLGIRTLGHRMVGTNRSYELCRLITKYTYLQCPKASVACSTKLNESVNYGFLISYAKISHKFH